MRQQAKLSSDSYERLNVLLESIEQNISKHAASQRAGGAERRPDQHASEDPTITH